MALPSYPVKPFQINKPSSPTSHNLTMRLSTFLLLSTTALAVPMPQNVDEIDNSITSRGLLCPPPTICHCPDQILNAKIGVDGLLDSTISIPTFCPPPPACPPCPEALLDTTTDVD